MKIMKTEADIRSKVTEIKNRMNAKQFDIDSIDYDVEKAKHDLLLWVLDLGEEKPYETTPELKKCFALDRELKDF